MVLSRRLLAWAAGLDNGAYVHGIALPLAVHAAITGREGEAVPLAAACGLGNLAIDLFDDWSRLGFAGNSGLG